MSVTEPTMSPCCGDSLLLMKTKTGVIRKSEKISGQDYLRNHVYHAEQVAAYILNFTTLHYYNILSLQDGYGNYCRLN